jgi:YD repeat-containing protein
LTLSLPFGLVPTEATIGSYRQKPSHSRKGVSTAEKVSGTVCLIRVSRKGVRNRLFDTTYAYTANPRGWGITTTDPAGQTSIASTDMLGRVTGIYGTASPSSTYDYWLDGATKTSFNGNGQATDYNYDQRGRLITINSPAPTSGGARPTTTLTYSIDSLLSSVLDPMSRNTTYQYDVGGRLQTVTQPDSDGTGPAVAAYQKVTRDALGNVRSQTDAMLDPRGKSTAFTYDAWSRRFTQTDPLSPSVGAKHEW